MIMEWWCGVVGWWVFREIRGQVWGNLGVIKLGELGIGWKFMVLTGWLRDRKSKVLYIFKGLNRGYKVFRYDGFFWIFDKDNLQIKYC